LLDHRLVVRVRQAQPGACGRRLAGHEQRVR
jgi:hypothetical protein